MKSTPENSAAESPAREYRRLDQQQVAACWGIRNGDTLGPHGHFWKVTRTLEDTLAALWGIPLPPAGPSYTPAPVAMVIRDRPGCITVDELRTQFEAAVRQVGVLARRLPLEAEVVAGQFRRYYYTDTDMAWIGFAIGMRNAERLTRELGRRIAEIAQSEAGMLSPESGCRS